MFIKHIFLSLLVLAPCLNAHIYFPQGVTKDSARTKRVQIAWDIHDVLAVKDKKAKWSAILGNILPIVWSKITGESAWDEINAIKKNGDPSGEAYRNIFLKYGNKKLAKMVKKVANSYTPRHGMEQLVRDINKAGINQRIASNIGPDFYVNLCQKFKSKHHCNLFDMIKPGKVVDYSNYGPASSRSKTQNPQVSLQGKPNDSFFSDFNKTYNPHNETFIIFIDDKIENIKAAVKAGWIGIHLDVKDKNATCRVRSELASLGIFAQPQ